MRWRPWRRSNYADTRRFALEELGDSDAHMRAAAARAFARPGGGRPTLYRLQPMLKDSSPEVRAAVASALVRGCGDLSFDYIQPLFKERDNEPLLAMAPELGLQSSPASAALLAKMMKRNAPDLRAAVTAALATRTDPAGRALFQPLADGVKRDQRAAPDARMMVYASAGPDELLRWRATRWSGSSPTRLSSRRSGTRRRRIGWLHRSTACSPGFWSTRSAPGWRTPRRASRRARHGSDRGPVEDSPRRRTSGTRLE